VVRRKQHLDALRTCITTFVARTIAAAASVAQCSTTISNAAITFSTATLPAATFDTTTTITSDTATAAASGLTSAARFAASIRSALSSAALVAAIASASTTAHSEPRPRLLDGLRNEFRTLPRILRSYWVLLQTGFRPEQLRVWAWCERM
jgi:hypothetical protein